MSYVLVSNNRLMGSLFLKGTHVDLLSSSSLKVLEYARDLVHKGYKLVNHPLYGNFRPHQQPYRTIILQNEHGCGQLFNTVQTRNTQTNSNVDITSLQLMEEALLVFQNHTVLCLTKTPQSMLMDCAMIDLELLRFTIETIGINQKPMQTQENLTLIP